MDLLHYSTISTLEDYQKEPVLEPIVYTQITLQL